MTPDEAAAILEVDKDGTTADILAAYSKKAQASGATSGGDLAVEKAQVQLLGEARTTLMTYRQKLQGAQQRTALTENGAATAATPQYGQRASTPAVSQSGWPEDASKRKTLTVEEEARRKQRMFIFAVVGLIFSITAWFWWLLEPLSLFGIGLSIWALVRIRGYGSGRYTATRIIAWVSIVLGALALIGNILLIVGALAG